MAPLPKPPGQRVRRHKDAPRGRKLPGTASVDVPALHDADEMHPRTLEWWRTIWKSPMAAVWLDADVPALQRLADLIELVNRGGARGWVHGEIRQLEDRYGLSPTARRRLQWEVEHARPVAVPDPTLDDDEERFLRAVRE